LVAPLDLENGNVAFGTIFRCAADFADGFDHIGVARMFDVLVLALDFVAGGATPYMTNPAFPLGTEESLAIGGGTMTDEFAAFAWLGG